MTLDEFIAVCDRFTNKRLFVTDRHGELVRDDRMATSPRSTTTIPTATG